MKTKNIDLMLSETLAHYNADQIVQGSYWDGIEQNGCFIGCLTHGDDAQDVTNLFGIELPLVELLENIYEGLPAKESKEFFKAIPSAIGVNGKDVSLVKWAFLRDTLKALPEQDKEIRAVIDPVIEGMILLAKGKPWPSAATVCVNANNMADYAPAHAALAAAADATLVAVGYAIKHADYTNVVYAGVVYAGDDYTYAAAAADEATNAACAAASYTCIAAGDDVWADAANTERKRQAASILQLIKDAPIEGTLS